MRKRFQFTDSADIHDMYFLDPRIMLVFFELVIFCEKEGLHPPEVTSAIRPKDNISKSDTHQTARALDIRTRNNYTEAEVQKIVYFLEDYDAINEVGAITSSGRSRLAYYHIGTGPHLHLQTRREL